MPSTELDNIPFTREELAQLRRLRRRFLKNQGITPHDQPHDAE